MNFQQSKSRPSLADPDLEQSLLQPHTQVNPIPASPHLEKIMWIMNILIKGSIFFGASLKVFIEQDHFQCYGYIIKLFFFPNTLG